MTTTLHQDKQKPEADRRSDGAPACDETWMIAERARMERAAARERDGGSGRPLTAAETLAQLTTKALRQYAPNAPEPDAERSVSDISSTEQAKVIAAERSPMAAAEPAAAPELPRKPMPEWQVSRREKRIAAAVMTRQDERRYRYEWMTPDDEARGDAELEALDRIRRDLLGTVRRQDGSLLGRLESVFAPNEKHTVRCIRDNAMFAATEWGKLWRVDQLLANLTLEACWGTREDGTCARDWHSQRARNMLSIVWMLYRAGSTRRAELGELRARGISLEFLCQILATDGKQSLHRNTLGGTHRTGSARNEDVGYLVALELAGVLSRVQYGDRRNNQQVQEYHLRVTPTDARVAAALDRNEAAFRDWVAQRWARFAQLDALHVLPWRAHARYVRELQAEKLAEIRSAIEGGSDPPS